MATRLKGRRPPAVEPAEGDNRSSRDRLLAALEKGPRLSTELAEEINAVVREAREASIAGRRPD